MQKGQRDDDISYCYAVCRIEQWWRIQTKVVRDQRVKLIRFVQKLRFRTVVVNQLKRNIAYLSRQFSHVIKLDSKFFNCTCQGKCTDKYTSVVALTFCSSFNTL